MKMFTVWCVVLFCGFLGLSAGEECLECMGRLNKEKMGRAVEFLVSAANIPEKVENMFKAKPGEKKPSKIRQKSAPSPSGMKCEFQEMPKVNITLSSDKTMNVKMNGTLNMNTTDGTKVDVDMHIILACEMTKDGFQWKECNVHITKEDVRISYAKDIKGPAKKMVDDMVTDKVLPPITQNMCDIVKTGLESPVAGKIPEMVEIPDDMKMDIKDMQETETHFEYWIMLSKGAGESEEESCMTKDHTSWKPECPMSDDALGDIVINNTDIEKHIKQIESHPIPVEGPEGEVRRVSFEGVRLVESPEGQHITYTTNHVSCKTEDPNDCTSYPGGKCSVQVKIAAEENELKILPASESCDQKPEPVQASDDHDSMCHKTNCILTGATKGLKIPLPGSMGTMAEIEARHCKSQTVVTASIPMLTSKE